MLNIGRDELLVIDVGTGRRTVVATLPGYAWGLDVAGPYAFAGLSRLRDGPGSADLPVRRRVGDPLCRVAAVDVRNRTIAGSLRFTAGVTEVFDVRLLPGVRRPRERGPASDDARQAFTTPTFSDWLRSGC